MDDNQAIDKRKLPGYLQGYQEGFQEGQEMGLEVARKAMELQATTRMIIVGREKERLRKIAGIITGIEGLGKGDENG